MGRQWASLPGLRTLAGSGCLDAFDQLRKPQFPPQATTAPNSSRLRPRIWAARPQDTATSLASDLVSGSWQTGARGGDRVDLVVIGQELVDAG
jgi:hypothetical protein